MNEPGTDVLAVIYAPLEKYPPSVNQVALLAEAGFTVAVIDCFHPDVECLPFGGDHPVRRIRGARYTEQFREPLPNSAVRLLRFLRFKITLERFIRQQHPRIIIAYDTYAFYLVGTLGDIRPEPRLVWHFHELPAFVSDVQIGGLVGRAENFIRDAAHTADMWIVPDGDRAEQLAQFIQPPHERFVVMNCPRRLEILPPGKLKQRLLEIGFLPQKVVLFQGAIDASRRPETIIDSMSRWPADSGLVLLGPVESGYKRTLLRRAADAGCAGRILFLDPVPYSEVLSYTVAADVGCCLVHEGGNKNWEYSAGAVNKRFEYMATGVPQVTNNGAGVSRIISQPNTGLLADPRDPGQVGEAIRELLSNEPMRMEMARNARSAHLSIFNYEAQFHALLELFGKWAIAAGSTSSIRF